MVVMLAEASVDDNTAPRLSCAIIRTVEILREKAGICKLEASRAANHARRQGLERDPCQRPCAVRSGDITVRSNSLSGVVARELSGLMGTEEVPHAQDTRLQEIRRMRFEEAYAGGSLDG